MTSAIFTELLKSLSFLSSLLLLGMLLRAKVKLFQNLFLPASVIGGFVGLLIVQTNIIPIPIDWVKTYSILPGVFIIPIFAAIPLGMSFGGKNQAPFFMPNILISFGIFMGASMAQSTVGYATNIFFSYVKPETELYRTFGYELSAGFAGGHGLAAATGKLLEGFGMPYWNISQGVAMTTATVGLIGGMVFGIIFINIALRNKKTALLKEASEIPDDMKRGFSKDIEKQTSLGRETFMSSSIETIAFHLAIIFAVCGVAYVVLNAINKTNITGLKVLPVWTYSMIIMFIVNFVIKKMNLDWMVDFRVKARITGAMSDFAIVSAITSLPLNAVLEYTFPLTVMMTLGFIVTYFIIFKFSKLCFKDYVFERSIISWGAATGVLITGMTLLRICDSEYDTPALKDFSLGFSLMLVSSLLIVPVLNSILATGSTIDNMVAAIVATLIYLSIAFLASLKKA